MKKISLGKLDNIFRSGSMAKKHRTSGVNKNNLALARVAAVDYEEHKVKLRVMTGEDQEFERNPIPITYPGAGSRRFLGSMPEEGDICVIGHANQESDGKSPSPVILAWLIPGVFDGYNWLTTQPFGSDEFPMDPKSSLFTRGVYSRVRHKLRHVGPGDILASSSKGSDLVLNEDVQLSNRRGNEIILRDADQSIVVRACQEFTALAGIRSYSGMIQRDAGRLSTLMYSDGTKWDTLNLVDVNNNEPHDDKYIMDNENDRPFGLLSPNPVFDKYDYSTNESYLRPNSGLYFDPSLDPYKFLKSGLFVGDDNKVLDGVYADGVYGGKHINRVSAVFNPSGRPYNAASSNVEKSNSYTEYRVEVCHTSDGKLPVTEQTDGFDSERLPSGIVIGGKNGRPSTFPYIENVIGTVVGNDPYSVYGRSRYGYPLTPRVFDEVGDVSPSMEVAMDGEIGSQAATYFRLTPPIPEVERDTFWSLTKDGRLFGYISGDLKEENSAEIAMSKGLKLSSGGKITFISNGGFEFLTGSNYDPKTNLGLNLGSDTGAVRIHGGGRVPDSPSKKLGGSDGDNPSLILESVDNTSIISPRKVSVNSKSYSANFSSCNIASSDSINQTTGGSYSVSTKVYNQTVTGKAVYAYNGPKDGLPTNAPFRSTTISGIGVGMTVDDYLVVSGGRNEKFIMGDHKTEILVGNITYKTVAGKFLAEAGLNSLEIDLVSGVSLNAAVGDISLNSLIGSFSSNSTVSASIKSVGPATLSGVSGLFLGGPGKIGGIVCGSDIDPLTGLPLALLGMGSPGHLLTLP